MIMRKPKNMRVVSWVDSSYGDCIDTRRSTSGDIHTIGGSLLSWKSNRQKTVSLSSTEAEYYALTEAAKEQQFLQMLMEELGLLEGPGIIYEDNEAAIYLSKNWHVSGRTKHIDVKAHYIREFVENGFGCVEGTRSKENVSDIMTKNQSVMSFKKDSNILLNGFQDMDDATFQLKVKDEMKVNESNYHLNIEQRENVVSNISVKNRPEKQRELSEVYEFVQDQINNYSHEFENNAFETDLVEETSEMNDDVLSKEIEIEAKDLSTFAEDIVDCTISGMNSEKEETDET